MDLREQSNDQPNRLLEKKIERLENEREQGTNVILEQTSSATRRNGMLLTI